MKFKLSLVIALGSAIGLSACSPADESPVAPTIQEATPALTASSSAVVGILGAGISTGGAVLLVPPGALPIGTVVSISVWSFGPETHYDVELGASATFLPAILTIHSVSGVRTSLYSMNGGAWSLVETSLTGVLTRPLSASASLKTDFDEAF